MVPFEGHMGQKPLRGCGSVHPSTHLMQKWNVANTHDAGLTIQWLLFPDSIKDDEEAAAARRAAAEAAGPQLPKVSVTSKPDELRRAFEVRYPGAMQVHRPSISTNKNLQLDTNPKLPALYCLQEAERQKTADAAKKKGKVMGMGDQAEAQPGNLKLMDRFNDTAGPDRQDP
eukprot:1150712-Pelagomonas_calceolata.AAC.3